MENLFILFSSVLIGWGIFIWALTRRQWELPYVPSLKAKMIAKKVFAT